MFGGTDPYPPLKIGGNKHRKSLSSNDTKTIKYPPPPPRQVLVVNKPLSDCITSPKKILPFHFSPKPTAERETKRQQTKQLP